MFYNNDGWIDIKAIKKACPAAFLFVMIGARQIGKTYGILDYFHEMQEPYIYMRGTGEELKYSLSGKVNLYEEKGFPWAHNMTIDTGTPTWIYDAEYESGNDAVALALALSDVAKIRGFGGKKYKRIFYDEFIPERTAFNRKGMGEALKNAYVTINSNRELSDEPPCELWLAANSNNLDNDILNAFNLIEKLLQMQKRNQQFCYIPERRLCMILFNNSPVSEKMSKTALFQCIGTGDKFANMALKNVFVNDDDAGVKSCPLAEYLPLLSIDNLTVYRHKSNSCIYVADSSANVAPHFDSDNATSYKAFQNFWRCYGNLAAIDGKTIFYNSYPTKLAFYKLVKL